MYIYFKMSLADINFFACCEPIVMMKPDILEAYPKLDGLYDKVKNDDRIKKWLDIRPVTDK